MKTGYRTERLQLRFFWKENQIVYDLTNALENKLIKAANSKLKRDKDALSKIVNMPLTEQEEKIVLTFIQWLGTSVGYDFLKGDLWFNYELANLVVQCKDHPISLTSKEYEIAQNTVAWGKSNQGRNFIQKAHRTTLSDKDIDFFSNISC